VTLVPFSGQADPEVVAYCQERGVAFEHQGSMGSLGDVDAIYLNAPRTVAHAQLLHSRGMSALVIDEELMARLRPHCVVLDPMQRSGDFPVEVQDERLAFYRQSENALFIRMALLHRMLSR
jgi:aspartate carbamoyltransferase catalytic subunit